MKKRALIVILCITTFMSCSRHLFTKEEAIKVATKRGNKISTNVFESDDGMVKILTRDSNYKRIDEIYQFNGNGEQLKYALIAFCDTCFKKYLFKTVNNGFYKWKKINDSTYISKYDLRRFLNVHKSSYSFEIVQHMLSRDEHENLIKNAEKSNL